MNIKKIIIPAISAGALLTGVLLKRNSLANAANIVSKSMPEPEKTFGGISISKLNELAKDVYHGLHCTIDQCGFLIFHYKSNRGHQTFHTQMTLDKTGKLINLGGHYPGQWWSTADEFAKRANELFQFKE